MIWRGGVGGQDKKQWYDKHCLYLFCTLTNMTKSEIAKPMVQWKKIINHSLCSIFYDEYESWCSDLDFILHYFASFVWLAQTVNVAERRTSSADVRFICSTPKITSSTAQGGGGSFKNRKPIGEIGCLWIRDGRAKPLMDWKVVEVSSLLSLSLAIYLPTYLSMYVFIYRSISLSFI